MYKKRLINQIKLAVSETCKEKSQAVEIFPKGNNIFNKGSV